MTPRHRSRLYSETTGEAKTAEEEVGEWKRRADGTIEGVLTLRFTTATLDKRGVALRLQHLANEHQVELYRLGKLQPKELVTMMTSDQARLLAESLLRSAELTDKEDFRRRSAN